MALTRTSLAVLLFLFAEPTDDFIPDHIEEAKLVGCFVGGNIDQTTDGFVIVQFANGRKDFRPVISRRTNPDSAMSDCIDWFRHMQEAWRKRGTKSGKNNVLQPESGVQKP